MKIFFSAIPLLVISALGRAQEDPPTRKPICGHDPYEDSCSMEDMDVLEITCSADDGNYDSCNCSPKGDAVCTEVQNALMAEGDKLMKANSCRLLCGTQSEGASETKCHFYRWEKHPLTSEGKYVCKMRSANNACLHADPCFDCDDDCTEEDRNVCESGTISCDGGALPTPTDPADCPGLFDYDINKIHWKCRQTQLPPASERSALGSNPYMDVTLSPNTICSTMKKCNAWNANVGTNYEYELVARCDGGHLTEEKGTWVPDSQTGDHTKTNEMIENNKLKEPDLVTDCDTTCDDLVLDRGQLDVPGIEVFCTYPLEEDDDHWTIKASNACVLLCDQVLTNDVSCVYKPHDGSKTWENSKQESVSVETFSCTPPGPAAV